MSSSSGRRRRRSPAQIAKLIAVYQRSGLSQVGLSAANAKCRCPRSRIGCDGSLTYGPLTNGSFYTYTYDARNRLLSAGGVSYGYDAVGNRTALTNGTNVIRFVVNPNPALSQVLMRVKNGVTNY